MAETLNDGNERIVIIDDSKKEYVRNTKSAYYETLYKDELGKIRTKAYPEMPHSEEKR